MRRWSFTVALLTAVLLMSGCAEPPSGPSEGSSAPASPPPSASPSPTALTEAEALDIAVATHRRFLEAEQTLIASGGVDTAPMKEVISDGMVEYYDWIVQQAQSDDFTVEGYLDVINAETKEYDENSITYYACEDWAHSQVYDSKGEPVGAQRDGVVVPFEVRVIDLKTAPKIDLHRILEGSDRCRQ